MTNSEGEFIRFRLSHRKPLQILEMAGNIVAMIRPSADRRSQLSLLGFALVVCAVLIALPYGLSHYNELRLESFFDVKNLFVAAGIAFIGLGLIQWTAGFGRGKS